MFLLSFFAFYYTIYLALSIHEPYRPAIDQTRDRYLLVETGWQNGYRIYGTLLHIDIIDQKIWIQHDGTEDGIADELVAAGIPQNQIILAFKSPEIRPYTGFAVA